MTHRDEGWHLHQPAKLRQGGFHEKWDVAELKTANKADASPPPLMHTQEDAMANNTPFESEPLSITTLITSRRQELGLTHAQLVKRAGYKNVTKGIRRLEGLLAGDLKTSRSLIQGLPAALNLPADLINRAVEETRRQIEQARYRAAQEEEAAWRASFKPHAIILTERNRPEPIFVAAFIGVERLLRVDFDLEGDRESYVQKALQGVQRHLAKWRGTIPAFGRPISGQAQTMLFSPLVRARIGSWRSRAGGHHR